MIGAAGFVGSALLEALHQLGEYRVVAVLRETHDDMREQGPYDVVVNAACPSRRYWASEHPAADRAATVARTQALLDDWDYGRFVQVSSISARTQLDTAYGRHRAEAEALCARRGELVVRLGPMYGERSKGALIDMLHDRPVYLSGESRQSFAPVSWCGSWIAANLSRDGLCEIGARTSIALREIRDAIQSRSEFMSDSVDDQFPVGMTDTDDWPLAADVVSWLRQRRLRPATPRQEP